MYFMTHWTDYVKDLSYMFYSSFGDGALLEKEIVQQAAHRKRVKSDKKDMMAHACGNQWIPYVNISLARELM